MAKGWEIGLAVGLVLALATAGVALGLVGTTGSNGGSAQCDGSAPKLTVNGTGMASGTPDLVRVTVAINVTEPTAEQALGQDDTKAQAVTAALKAGGAAAKDVQTADFTISPQYKSANVVTGYQVSNTITFQLHDLATAGSLIDAVAAAGGNATQIQSLVVSVQDTRSLEDQARAQAVSQAGTHARAMARAAGERLAMVCSLTDTTQNPVTYNQPFGVPAAGLGAGSSGSAPIAAGTEQVSAQVSEVYALAPE
jgi:uncharacterized protein YggE